MQSSRAHTVAIVPSNYPLLYALDPAQPIPQGCIWQLPPSSQGSQSLVKARLREHSSRQDSLSGGENDSHEILNVGLEIWIPRTSSKENQGVSNRVGTC